MAARTRKKNTNCLEGIRCPNCGSLGPFLVISECLAIVADDGVEQTSDHDWSYSKVCACQDCWFEDAYSAFKLPHSKRALVKAEKYLRKQQEARACLDNRSCSSM